MTLPLGSYFPDRDQPPLHHGEEDVVARFHDLYYRRWHLAGADTVNLSWFGFKLMKCPLDLWIYQELIVRTRPEIIVECGTFAGGSALYLASICDMLGHGSVITIDIEPQPDRPIHPRITYVTGSSIDPAVVARTKEMVAGARAIVILDSDHHQSHVKEEMDAYASLVQVGDYLIVEDTNINGNPTFLEYGSGPMEAVEQFLAGNDKFQMDFRCERFMLTFNPRGYLRRIKP
jgi:cephalosporin hydroxylase